MNRFFVSREQLSSSKMTAYIKDVDAIQHITKSLRLKVGDCIEISAAIEENYIAEILEISKRRLELKLIEKLANTEMKLAVDLYQGIVKGHKWDFLIQKSVECGVRDIYPIEMQRSVSRIRTGQEQKKQRRWQKIAHEASQQAKRSYLTQVHAPQSLTQALDLLADYDMVLVAYEEEQECNLKHYVQALEQAKSIAIWIGPEGGIAETEIAALSKYAKCISLGKRILRTETASMFLLAQISYLSDLE